MKTKCTLEKGKDNVWRVFTKDWWTNWIEVVCRGTKEACQEYIKHKQLSLVKEL